MQIGNTLDIVQNIFLFIQQFWAHLFLYLNINYFFSQIGTCIFLRKHFKYQDKFNFSKISVNFIWQKNVTHL